MTRLRRGVIAALAVLGVLLALLIAPAAEEDLRRLLAELWIQVPPHQASAPPFSLPDLSGTPVRLGDHKGRPVMLPRELPSIERLYGVGEAPDVVRRAVKARGYAVTATPTVYLVNRQARIVGRAR